MHDLIAQALQGKAKPVAGGLLPDVKAGRWSR